MLRFSKSQIGFIKDSIGSFNHPELLQVEGIYSTEFNWNNGLSIAQMVSSISSIEQTTNSYSLSKQTAKLLTSVQSLGNVSDPIIAFIFVSNTSDAALAGADRYISQLKNVEITFILLGMDTLNSMDLSVTQLAKFSRKIVRWYIVNEYNYPIFYPEDYGCKLFVIN
uniref:VWFA domain-containing protein n=1 Tax=Panagrolaimus davidi TaxID=227884 RepID=A0A914PD93_9BILA